MPLSHIFTAKCHLTVGIQAEELTSWILECTFLIFLSHSAV